MRLGLAVLRAQVMVPRQISETRMPVRPSGLYFMGVGSVGGCGHEPWRRRAQCKTLLMDHKPCCIRRCTNRRQRAPLSDAGSPLIAPFRHVSGLTGRGRSSGRDAMGNATSPAIGKYGSPIRPLKPIRRLTALLCYPERPDFVCSSPRWIRHRRSRLWPALSSARASSCLHSGYKLVRVPDRPLDRMPDPRAERPYPGPSPPKP